MTAKPNQRFCFETRLSITNKVQANWCGKAISRSTATTIGWVQSVAMMSPSWAVSAVESAGLAAAHSIHNGLTALAETHSFHHGEKVAFGVLAGLQLADAPPDESEAVFSFCEEIGLPTTLADIGLGNAGRAQLMVAAEGACAPGQPVHHEAGTITPAKVLDAMLAADAIGRARRARGTGHQAAGAPRHMRHHMPSRSRQRLNA